MLHCTHLTVNIQSQSGIPDSGEKAAKAKIIQIQEKQVKFQNKDKSQNLKEKAKL